MPGKEGEWRFDKRTYTELPPPRDLKAPPPGIENALVRMPACHSKMCRKNFSGPASELHNLF